MKIKNKEIEQFGSFLMSLELRGKDSRMRTRLVKLLQERLELINKEYQEIVQQFAMKDEDGEVMFEEMNGNRMIKVTDTDGFRADTDELMNEYFIIEMNEERSEMLKSVQDSVLNCDQLFKGQEAILYDRWCEIVE